MTTSERVDTKGEGGRRQTGLRLFELCIHLAFAAQVMVCWTSPKEDVVICFRYARNWARGAGLVYNPGEYVEGFSNSVWTMALGVLHWAGMTLFAADNLLVLFCAVAASVVLCRAGVKAFGDTWTARLPALLLLLNTNVPASYGNGLEGSGVALGVALVILGLVQGASPALGLGASLLVLLRPEGMLYAGIIGVFCVAGLRRDRSEFRRHAAVLLMIACVFLLLAAFRAGYYGDFIPNTVRAKEIIRSFTQVKAGLLHLRQYLDPANAILMSLAVLTPFMPRFRRVAAVLLACAAVNMAIVAENGGDWMPYFRLLTPFFAVPAFLGAVVVHRLGKGGGKRAFLAAAALLAVSMVHFQPHLLRVFGADLPYELRRMADPEVSGFAAFNDGCTTLEDYHLPDELLVSEWGGMPPFIMDGLRTIELLGLTDRELARYRGPGVEYVPTGGHIAWPLIAQRRPTLLFLFAPFLKERVCAFDKAAPGFLDQFLIVQRTPLDAEMMALLVREDRPILAKLLKCAGMVTPVRDYIETCLADNAPESPPLANRPSGKVISRWADGGWTSPSGAIFRPAWTQWDDQPRYSVRLPLAQGRTAYTRDADDDSALLFLVGRHALLMPSVQMSVTAVNAVGARRLVQSRELLNQPDGGFFIDAVSIQAGALEKGDTIEVAFDSPCAGGVFLGAYRWTRADAAMVSGAWQPSTVLAVPVTKLPEGGDAAQFRKRLEDNPQDAEACILLARELLRAGSLGEAKDWLARGLALDRAFWVPGAVLYAEGAERLYRNGDPAGAIELMRTVRTLDPEYLGHALRMAEMLSGNGQPDAALEQCRDVLARAPESPKTAALLDRIHEQRGTPRECVAEWRAVTERHPKAVIPWQHFADALEKAGDQGAAAAARMQAAANAAAGS